MPEPVDYGLTEQEIESGCKTGQLLLAVEFGFRAAHEKGWNLERTLEAFQSVIAEPPGS